MRARPPVNTNSRGPRRKSGVVSPIPPNLVPLIHHARPLTSVRGGVTRFTPALSVTGEILGGLRETPPTHVGGVQDWRSQRTFLGGLRETPPTHFGGVGVALSMHRGSVLILVLVVVVLLTVASYSFSEFMFSERRAVRIYGKQLQADALVESGAHYVANFLSLAPPARQVEGGDYDNPGVFRNNLVVDDVAARSRGRFSALATRLGVGASGGIRYGLENESARLNLNVLSEFDRKASGSGHKFLMELPGMTIEIADAILDWLDPDDSTRPFGAEANYYSGMDPPYAPRNGALDRIEELLKVRGIDVGMLFGSDVDGSGVVNTFERTQILDTSAQMLTDLGWSSYFTLHSSETTAGPDGEPKIDVNAQKLEKLHDDLKKLFTEEEANFIILYRQYSSNQAGQSSSAGSSGPSGRGPQSSAPSGNESRPSDSNSSANTSGSSAGQPTGRSPSRRSSTAKPSASASSGSVSLDLKKPAQASIASLLDLIGATIQIPGENNQPGKVVQSPFTNDARAMREYLMNLMDFCTTDANREIRGRININLAEPAIMAGIPALQPATADSILRARGDPSAPPRSDRRHATWILVEGIVDLETMKKMMPYVTAGGNVYRTQIVGFFDESGPVSRSEIVFDATQIPPKIRQWRNLTHLGHGYTRDVLGVESGVVE